MFITVLQTFGKIPNYLQHCQLQAEAPQKEKETEEKQFTLEGRYITEPERRALLQVVTYFSTTFKCQISSIYIYYKQMYGWYNRMCKLVRKEHLSLDISPVV
jgi:hypothetical protein